jgi:fatty aldehyde-generating acyl-ACP reductase
VPSKLALIGHQDNWSRIAAVVNGLRPPELGAVPLEELKTIVPWIPPRVVSRLRLFDFPVHREIPGIYIETFITPDELAGLGVRSIVEKVRDAIRVAENEGASVAALGGFTSIVLEGEIEGLSRNVALTTGNTLTAALILKGVEAAAREVGIYLGETSAVVIGATGDIGSGVCRALGPKVRRLLLCARNRRRLETEAAALRGNGVTAVVAADASQAIGEADVIVSAASTPGPVFSLADARPGSLVCDAGFPNNLSERGATGRSLHIFHGGLGRMRGGFQSADGLIERFYGFPAPHVAHGCLLEGIVLALAGRNESFSKGRGNITPERMAEIMELGEAHGLELAPFFEAAGLWSHAARGKGAAAEGGAERS